MAILYHITGRAEWEAAQERGLYRGDSLDGEGFIHCSTAEQVVRVADSWFRGQRGLVVLEIEGERVAAEVRYENLEGGEELFPHIYGVLNLDAVVRVVALQVGDDGCFLSPVRVP